MLTTSSRPNWKKLFSQAEGMPMRRILPMTCRSMGYKEETSSVSSCPFRLAMVRIMTAATARETRVGTATPATPIFSTNTHRAFPATLIPFIHKLTCMETLLLPTLRKMAAPALYRAMKGKDRAVMRR